MYENKLEDLAPKKVFYRRMAKNVAIGIIIIIFCLFIGIFGYHYFDNIPWIDSLHNASMILSGMGPVVEIKSTGGKWFSSMYALFSGIAFISNIGIILAPAIHRFFHRLHLEGKAMSK